MVDKALVLRKLAELEQYLAQVREYANVTVEQYSSDWKMQRILERTLRIMIETCVDVAGHIIVIILTKHLDDFLTYKNAIINVLKEGDNTWPGISKPSGFCSKL